MLVARRATFLTRFLELPVLGVFLGFLAHSVKAEMRMQALQQVSAVVQALVVGRTPLHIRLRNLDGPSRASSLSRLCVAVVFLEGIA